MASISYLKYKDIKWQLSSHSSGLYCYLFVTLDRQKLQNMLYYYHTIEYSSIRKDLFSVRHPLPDLPI